MKLGEEYKDGFGRKYADFVDGSFSWNYIEKPVLDQLIPRSAYQPGRAVVDLGAGPGRLLCYHLNRGMQVSDWTGVDISERMINAAMLLVPGARHLKIPMQEIHFDEGQLSLVTAVMCCHYLEDRDLARTLASVREGLKPGGRLILVDDHPQRTNLISSELAGRLLDEAQEGERKVPTPWKETTVIYHRTAMSYYRAVADSGLHIDVFDNNCRILPEGEKFPEKYADYNRTPPRLAILAIK